MNVQAIIDRARRLTYTSSNQYTDAQAVEDFNIIYKEIVSRITYEVNEDFFWDILQTSSVVDQSEYVLDPKVRKIRELFIKYNSTDDYYTKAEEIDWNTLALDKAWYEANVSQSTPKYYVADESVFLLPAPDEAVSNGVRMNALLDLMI